MTGSVAWSCNSDSGISAFLFEKLGKLGALVKRYGIDLVFHTIEAMIRSSGADDLSYTVELQLRQYRVKKARIRIDSQDELSVICFLQRIEYFFSNDSPREAIREKMIGRFVKNIGRGE